MSWPPWMRTARVTERHGPALLAPVWRPHWTGVLPPRQGHSTRLASSSKPRRCDPSTVRRGPGVSLFPKAELGPRGRAGALGAPRLATHHSIAEGRAASIQIQRPQSHDLALGPLIAVVSD